MILVFSHAATFMAGIATMLLLFRFAAEPAQRTPTIERKWAFERSRPANEDM